MTIKSFNARHGITVGANTIAIVDANGNITANTILVGGSALNSTAFAGTANNASFFNGQPAAYYTNASNLSTGTINVLRLPTSGVTANVYGNSSSIPVVTVDTYGRVTSVTTSAVAGVTSFDYTAANSTFSIGTGAGSSYTATITAANSSVAGIVTVLDSVTNTSISIAASANTVKNAYDRAIDANTRAASAQTAAISAYSNAVSYTDSAIAAANVSGAAAIAYTNATSFASNVAATAYSNAVSVAASDATNKAANAYSNAISYAATIAGTAYSNAVSAAATDATTKANNAYTTAVSAASTDATNKAANAYSNAISYAATIASTAYTNAVSVAATDATSKANNAYTTAVAAAASDATTKANSAYTIAVSVAASDATTKANNAYTTAVSAAASDASSKAATAYTNATGFAANASNISSGTLAEARLPFRMNQNVRTTDTVEFGNMTVSGNLTVTGTTVTVNANNLVVQDNMIYLNDGNTVANPDLGIAGNYNDGTYRHAGFFRDATDGVWKVYDQYLPEPDASPYIDTSNASFRIASFQANVVTMASANVGGATINSTSYSGSANNASNLGTYAANNYPRKSEGAAITGAWDFSNTGIVWSGHSYTNTLDGSNVYQHIGTATSTNKIWNLRVFKADNNYTTFVFNSAGVATAENSYRAPIFYDIDNTSYYFDGASTSAFNVGTFAGSITASGTGSIGTNLLLQSSGGSPNIQFNRAGYQNWFLGSPNNSTDFGLAEGSSSSYVMYFKSGGNVGIGTTSPAAKLQVIGNAIIGQNSNSSTAARLDITAGGSGYDSTIDLGYYGTFDAAIWHIKRHGTDNTFRIAHAGNGPEEPVIVATTSGNVGVGTTSPLARLVVSNGSNENVEFTAGSATVNGGVIQYINRGTAATRPDLNYYLASGGGAHKFYTNDTERVRINSVGDVGIGATSIGARLEIYQNVGGTNAIRMNTNFAGGNYVDLNPSITGVSNGGYSISLNGNIYQVISVDGNTGVGTTSPATKLHVGGGSLRIEHPGDRALDFIRSGASTFTIEHDTSRMYFYNASTANNIMSFSNASNVGIGVADADYKLDVRGIISSTVDVRAPIFYDSNNTGFYIDPATGSNLTGQVQITGGTAMTGGWNRTLYLAASFPSIVFNSGNSKYSGIAVDYTDANDGMRFWVNGSSADISGTGTIALRINTGNYIIANDVRATIFYDSNDTAYYVDPASASILNEIRLSNSGAITYNDRGRDAATVTLPNWRSRSVRWDFVTASSVGTSGNYAGLMTFSPWDGTTASTGDASYQMAFGGTAVNGGGVPQLRIRKGIDTTWNSFYTIHHDGLSDMFAANSFRAPIFYDSDNTAYYTDPAATSVMSQINFGDSTKFIRGGSSGQTILGAGSVNDVYVQVSSSYYPVWNSGNFTPSNYLALTGGTLTGNLTLDAGWSGENGVIRIREGASNDYGAYIKYTASDTFEFGTRNGSTTDVAAMYLSRGTAAIYTPISYDSNNTAYYLDPASTTYINQLQILGGNPVYPAQWTTGYQSSSDFVDGTLVTTDIPATGFDGDSFIIEITGKSYGGVPTKVIAEGYLYNNTIINYAGISYGGAFASYIRVFENSGVLKFWWPRISYWNSFEIRVISMNGPTNNTITRNRVTSITNSTEPSGTKKQTITLATNMRADISATNSVDLRAPIFYDSNNTVYYIDGAGTSVLNVLRPNTLQFSSGNQAADLTNGSYFILRDPTANPAIYLGGADPANYYDNTNHYFRTRAGSTVATINGNGMYAPVFYDSNDTNYYVDSSSNSVLNTLYFRNSAGSNIKAIYANYFGYSTSYRTLVIGNEAYQTVCIGVDPIGNLSGSFNGGGSGVEVMFKNGVTFISPNSSNNSYNANLYLGDGYIVSNGSVRSPIFYDSNNTAYYFDGASVSNLVNLTVNGVLTMGASNPQFWLSPNSAYQRVDGRDDATLYSRMHWYGVRNDGATSNFRHAWYDGSAYFNIDADTGTVAFTRSGGAILSSNGSWRAPIFYDTDNTGYYLDPSSTSNINAITINGQSTMAAQRSLVASNYGHGVYGLYSAERYQHVWSMGVGYDLPANGISTGNGGNLYGLAWSYDPGYGGAGNNAQSKSGLLHQLLLMMNGITYFAAGNGVWTSGIGTSTDSWRAPIFYDTNNTAFYTDPASTSILNTIVPGVASNSGGGTWSIGGGAWGGNGPAATNTNSSTGIIYSGGSGSQLFTLGSGPGQLSLQIDGSFFVGDSISYNPASISGGNAGSILAQGSIAASGVVYSNTDMRAPIFYDGNDTGFYINPHETSVTRVQWIKNWGGTAASPTEYLDWPYPALTISAFGNFTAQTMLAFALPNDGNYFTGDSVWNFRLNQTANATTSAGVSAMNFGGPGILYLNPSQYTQSTGSMRSPIFYDTDNTSFYFSSDASVNTIYAYNWFRSYGATGWYNETYAGGWFMEDSTWVRTYNSKNVYTAADIAAGGNIIAYYSDERLKTKTGTISNAINKVQSLEGFTYVENELARSLGYKNKDQQVGVSAQQVQAVLPEAVSLAPIDYETLEDGTIVSKSGENYLTVDYSRLVPLLIEAIKEQQLTITEQSAKINTLEAKLDLIIQKN